MQLLWNIDERLISTSISVVFCFVFFFCLSFWHFFCFLICPDGRGRVWQNVQSAQDQKTGTMRVRWDPEVSPVWDSITAFLLPLLDLHLVPPLFCCPCLHAELIHLQHSHIWWFDSFLIRSFLCLFCFVTIFTFSADFLSPLFTSCWCHPPLPPPATVLVWCPLFIYFSILHLHFLHPPVPFFSLLSYLFTVQAVTADGYSEGLFAVWNQEGVKFSRSFGMINNVPLGNKS